MRTKQTLLWLQGLIQGGGIVFFTGLTNPAPEKTLAAAFLLALCGIFSLWTIFKREGEDA